MRTPAPPYLGESPFAHWHFSEDPSLSRFVPRHPPSDLGGIPVVWAVDTRHAPLYWFPRDCPRGCIWSGPDTTLHDREKFFGLTAASRIHVIEADWLDRLRDCRLYAYRLPAEPFVRNDVGGYWNAAEPVDAIGRVIVGDLLARHAEAGIELRVTPSIWPFWRQAAESTVEFSGCRLRNSVGAPAGA